MVKAPINADAFWRERLIDELRNPFIYTGKRETDWGPDVGKEVLPPYTWLDEAASMPIEAWATPAERAAREQEKAELLGPKLEVPKPEDMVKRCSLSVDGETVDEWIEHKGQRREWGITYPAGAEPKSPDWPKIRRMIEREMPLEVWRWRMALDRGGNLDRIIMLGLKYP